MTIVATPPAACPVPARLTVVDPASLAMFSVALLPPPDVGANVTETVVDVPAASVVAAGDPTSNCDASVPVIVNGVVSVSGAVPLLVTVTGAMLAPPTAVAANVTVAGDATSAGPDAPVTTMSASERGTI